MIACITEDENIKNGLYPGPGANVSTAKGGLPKTEHQFKLFTMVFGDDPKCTNTPEERTRVENSYEFG